MLILKYSKTGAAKYVPHVDTLRVLVRTLKRAGISVEYSAGFNPHMLLNMSPPLPVGIESVTEFVEIVTSATTEGFIEQFNKNCPDGFKALDVWQTEKSPRITANAAAAEYTAETNMFDACFQNVSSGTNGGGEKVSAEIRGCSVNKPNISSGASGGCCEKTPAGINCCSLNEPKLYALSAQNGKLTFAIACGNNNLRPDRFLEALAQKCGLPPVKPAEIKITREKLFAGTPEKLVLIDSFIGESK